MNNNPFDGFKCEVSELSVSETGLGTLYFQRTCERFLAIKAALNDVRPDVALNLSLASNPAWYNPSLDARLLTLAINGASMGRTVDLPTPTTHRVLDAYRDIAKGNFKIAKRKLMFALVNGPQSSPFGTVKIADRAIDFVQKSEFGRKAIIRLSTQDFFPYDVYGLHVLNTMKQRRLFNHVAIEYDPTPKHKQILTPTQYFQLVQGLRQNYPFVGFNFDPAQLMRLSEFGAYDVVDPTVFLQEILEQRLPVPVVDYNPYGGGQYAHALPSQNTVPYPELLSLFGNTKPVVVLETFPGHFNHILTSKQELDAIVDSIRPKT